MHHLAPITDHSAEDTKLMERLVQQEPDALRELYKRYQNILRSVVLRVVHDESDSEEVLQDVFLQLWTRAESYSPEKGKPLGWLITLARRRAIDRLRQRFAYRRATDRFEAESKEPKRSPGGERLHESEASLEDLHHYLHRLMCNLPPAQMDVLQRTFFDGLSQREIAARMHLPLGTVKTRIELGLRKLSHVMAGARQKVI